MVVSAQGRISFSCLISTFRGFLPSISALFGRSGAFLFRSSQKNSNQPDLGNNQSMVPVQMGPVNSGGNFYAPPSGRSKVITAGYTGLECVTLRRSIGGALYPSDFL
jgi:hypothetical protein